MRQTHKTLLTAAILLVILVAAVLGYNALTKHYAPENFVTPGLGNLSGKPQESETYPSSGETVTIDNEKPEAPSPEETEEVADYSAPDFTIYDADGNAAKLSDFFGKPLAVNFWATWCGPCQSEMPHFDKAAAERDDVTVLMVNLTDGQRDTVESVKKFVDEAGYTFPLWLDTDMDAADTYYVYSIPMTLFITADGQLADYYTGAMSEELLNTYLDLLVEFSASLETAAS